MTLATPASGFTFFQADSESEMRIEAIISGADTTLPKTGSGLLTISRASTFTGATNIAFDPGAFSTLNAAVNDALGSTSSIEVEHGSALMLSNAAVSDRIKNDAPIRLEPVDYTGIPSSPPRIRRAGGGNEGLGNTIGLGVLTLTSVDSILDYGGEAAGNGTLTFRRVQRDAEFRTDHPGVQRRSRCRYARHGWNQ